MGKRDRCVRIDRVMNVSMISSEFLNRDIKDSMKTRHKQIDTCTSNGS